MFKINDHDGLTPFGLQYIKEMERLGIIIDVSHLSDAGFYDVYHHTTKPFVASHSNARLVCKARYRCGEPYTIVPQRPVQLVVNTGLKS